MSSLDIWEEVAHLMGKYYATIDFQGGSLYAWSGELRLTLTNPAQAPARCMSFFSGGGLNPATVARQLLDDCSAWLAETGIEPLAPPEY